MYLLPQAQEEYEVEGKDKPDGEEAVSTDFVEGFDLEGSEWSQVIAEVRIGRGLHPSAKQTWARLNKYFEGHHIPVRSNREFCENCPRCQKDRKALIK